jgi:hypothetical protein
MKQLLIKTEQYFFRKPKFNYIIKHNTIGHAERARHVDVIFHVSIKISIGILCALSIQQPYNGENNAIIVFRSRRQWPQRA